MTTMSNEKVIVQRLPPIGSQQARQMSPRHTRKYEGLTGPTYSLPGNAHYTLPPPSVIRPYQDTKTGTLDTWPAHASSHHGKTTLALTRDKQLVLVEDDSGGKQSQIPKPKFLEQLEAFLHKELRALDCTEVNASDLRLQAYREVFEYLIEDFKTYKPLLSAIKNEYEMMLAYQREQIRQMEPLKQMLVTVSEQCDQKIMSLRDQEKQEIIDLKGENKKLIAKMDSLHQEQTSLEAQVERLQEELASEYLKYRNECDARKLLVTDINDLRYQQEDLLMSQQTMKQMEEEQDDPVTLRIALKKAREDEAAASKRLSEMEANYGDVIPRRDYESLQKQFAEIEGTVDTARGDFDKLQQEHEALLAVHKQVLQQRDDFYVEVETLRRSATPRPDWNRCADFVAGGITRWQELSENKTSAQMMEVLLNEISGGAGDSTGAEFFDGQGTGDSVPKYLQHEGKVRNRRLGKRDCILLVRDIFREKSVADSEREDGGREKMADFVHNYLQKRFALEQLVVEWAYNLHDACQRYAHDDLIGMFWDILNENMDEEVYHGQLQIIARLLNHMTKMDVDKGNQGALNKADFMTTLKEFFSWKKEDELTALVKAAEVELEIKDEIDAFEYKNLFMEDDEGKTGPFLEAVKKQHTNDRLSFVEDIKQQVDADSSHVTPEEIRRAMMIVDPKMETAEQDKHLCWAFKTGKEELDTVEPTDVNQVFEHLKRGDIRPTSSALV